MDWLAASSTVLFAFLFALDHPLDAQNSTALFVSDYNFGNGRLASYDINGNSTGMPVAFPRSLSEIDSGD
jgi:hypothetical protein